MIVFAYGTLTVDIVRDRVLGHPVDTRDAVLRGYSKVCGWDYLTLVPSDSSVRGVVFEADADDVARMDVWEDVPVYPTSWAPRRSTTRRWTTPAWPPSPSWRSWPTWTGCSAAGDEDSVRVFDIISVAWIPFLILLMCH